MTAEYGKMKFPDDLLQMWNYAHCKQSNILSEAEYENNWKQLLVLLTAIASKNLHSQADASNTKRNSNRGGVLTLTATYCGHLAQDYIMDELLGPPDARKAHLTKSFLIRDFKKYCLKKNNPDAYEAHSILCEALHDMEDLNLIKRDPASIGKYYSGLTLFALIDCEDDSTNIKKFSNYEAKKSSVPRYTTTARAGSWEHTRLLTPTNAKDLVIHLLEAFGGWTRLPDLFTAMKNHIPELFSITFYDPEWLPAKDEDDADQSYRDYAAEYGEAFMKQVDMKVASTSEQIWTKICTISKEVFCLYYLPQIEDRNGLTLAELGATSTISDQNAKIVTIVQTHMKGFWAGNDHSAYERELKKSTISQIFQRLNGRCTENQLIPDLYKAKVQKKDQTTTKEMKKEEQK